MKPEKILCEICGETDKAALQLHHIVERTDKNTDNSWYNLACICASCHSKHHHGSLKIIGIYPSTKLPYKRTVIYERDGISNVPGIEKPYYEPKPKAVTWHYSEQDNEDKK